jgi:hypothetical protein
MLLVALYLWKHGDGGGNGTISLRLCAFESRHLQRNVSLYTTFSRCSAILKLIQIYFI